MKDHFNKKSITLLAATLQKSMPQLSEQVFIKQCLRGLHELELRARVDHIIDVLACHLPKQFTKVDIILRRFKTHWLQAREQLGSQVQVFIIWPVIDYVGKYGLASPRLALPLLAELTPIFTAEFAIRPFISEHFAMTYHALLTFAQHEDEHVRRLASEGARPRLPWGTRLVTFCEDPKPLLPILELLRDDPSEYVRRSVANNLNDIAKDHPELVIQVCKAWLRDASEERRWIVRHATRTLVKEGNVAVFPLLGYTKNPKITKVQLALNVKHVAIGGSIALAFSVTSAAKKNQQLVLDYVVYHQKAKGELKPKVFKWKNLTLAPGQTVQLTKKHSFKKVTTRQYYKGKHKIAVQINGVIVGCPIALELT